MTSFAFLAIDPRYMIDSDGNVYGVHSGGKELNPKAGRYAAVRIGRHGNQHVHRLVATTFIPNPDSKPDVAHWDGDGHNNPASNLRWATEAENMSDKKRHGTNRAAPAKLSHADRDYIRSRAGEHWGIQQELARMFGVSDSTISMITNGKRCYGG